MRVILDIHEKYADVLTVSAVGVSPGTTNFSTAAVDLSEHTYIRLDENGILQFTPEEVKE
jgi:hypothetical protein